MVETNLLAWIDRQRSVNVAARDEIQGGGRNAYDGCGDAVQNDGAADERRVRAEAPLPQALAKHCNRSGSRPFFVVVEDAARDRLYSQHARKCRTDWTADELLRFSCPGQRVVVATNRGQLLERVVLLSPGEKVQYRCTEGGEMQLVVLFGNLHEPAGVTEGQRPQHHGIHNAEDRDVCADSEGNGQHNGGREQSALSHGAHCEGNVIHFWHSPGVELNPLAETENTRFTRIHIIYHGKRHAGFEGRTCVSI